jgi:hypothetical protein
MDPKPNASEEIILSQDSTFPSLRPDYDILNSERMKE